MKESGMPRQPGWLERMAATVGLELDELLIAAFTLSIVALVAVQVIVLTSGLLARSLGLR